MRRLIFRRALAAQSAGATARFDAGRAYDLDGPLADFAVRNGYADAEGELALGPAPENKALPGAGQRRRPQRPPSPLRGEGRDGGEGQDSL